VNILQRFPPIMSVNIWSPTTPIFSGFSFRLFCTFKNPDLSGFFAKYSYGISNAFATLFTFSS